MAVTMRRINRRQWAVIVGLLLAEVLVGVGIARTDGVRYRAEKGLAMAVSEMGDLARLGVGWYYQWGWCDAPNCVPMVRSMQLPPSCPAYLLVGNEPNAREPYGAPISPKAAAAHVAEIERQCPQSHLVVGNVSADDWSRAGGWGSGYAWLREFLREYRVQSGRWFTQTLGVHCYTQHLASYCISQLSMMRGLYGGEVWVTEFGIVSGDAKQFSRLLSYIAVNFSRWAAYTNRQPYPCGWCLPRGVELVREDGTLSPTGVVYSGN